MKKKKIVRKAAPAGFVTWSETSFERLVGGAPEPLESRMQVSAAMLINLIARGGDVFANARALLKRLFFDPKKYDLTRVGRYKINQKLNLKANEDERVLLPSDFVSSIRYLLKLRQGEGILDDIDHLGSRRVRAVGELLSNQCRVGLARTERLVKERMTLFDVNLEGMTPQKLINPKALSAVVRDFFGRSQLSQFMDQINPLAELTHKRRLSALGPGGLNRDRAGFEVRDVHPSHYGRICPIETPEGPNIGLINSMSTFARINDFGFIETPYRKIVNGIVQDKLEYLTADQEETHKIAQANNPLKFFPDADSALMQMMNAAMPGYMAPVRAYSNAFDDLRAHELAMMAGMRAALAGVLKRFDPVAIEQRLQAAGASE